VRADIVPVKTLPDYQLTDEEAAPAERVAGRRLRSAARPTGVIRGIRPDRDLTGPGLREAWEDGDRSRFFHDEDLDPGLRRR
jgi:hypothetical protein